MKSKFIYILLSVFAVFVLNSCHCRCCGVPEYDLAQISDSEGSNANAFCFSESDADGCTLDDDCASYTAPYRAKSFLLHSFRIPVRRNSNTSSAMALSGSCNSCTAVYAVSGYFRPNAADAVRGNSRYLISLRKLVI